MKKSSSTVALIKSNQSPNSTTIHKVRPHPTGTAEIRFFDVTVTGQWSSPSGCLLQKSFDRSTKARKDRYFAGFKAEKSLIVLGFLCRFDLLNGFFNTSNNVRNG